ncbi:[protein-PII] uridylyltransferase [Thorsellia anophelis]|uniref:Bifunctional uridylyltransferase/uridylyl-removing enzyme n=1 Tax=Thorsellia anophelis DSM 18579 TaxID=1123402 RepID=A0A1H9ZVE5_9GAMM|nr:[protein-PII] uridylyltransferase [Thorsellia anophelis]SES85683.1 UTP--GlnB (protein PII) uridylyltransferase, GlnD [Thorsellia anophelis DSM 18579]
MDNRCTSFYLKKIENCFSLPLKLALPPSSLQSNELKSFKLSLKQTLNEFTGWQIELVKSQLTARDASSIITTVLEHRTNIIDSIVKLWFDSSYADTNSESKQLTVMAIGGYGRSQLSIYSDIDILILHEKDEITEQEANEISLLTQLFWDIGLIPSIQTSSFKIFLTLMQEDISLATSVLSARTLIGKDKYSKALVDLVQSSQLWSHEAFIKEKLHDQKVRHDRYQSTGYHLEPDIKQNIGGLRDLHLIYWVIRKCYKEYDSLDDLFKSSMITEKEFHIISESEKILLLYRFALHSILQRPDDRLLFTHQISIVENYPFFQNLDSNLLTMARTNLVSHVESMMKCLYQNMASISLQTRIIYEIVSAPFRNISNLVSCKVLSDEFMLKIYTSGIDEIRLSSHESFSKYNILSLMPNQQFTPDNLMRFFYHLAEYEVTFDHIELETLRSLNQIYSEFPSFLVDSSKARADFIKILMHPNAIKFALIPLHKLCILWHYMPNWTHVVGLMQFDRFHAYTVDEHTFQVLAQIELMKDESNKNLASMLYKKQSKTSILTLAGLFHDVAKGLGGEHAKKGREIFDLFARQHSLDLEITNTTGWLIEHHLLLSVTAQRRDISDLSIIAEFAKQVGTQERLDLLYILTVADIKGTNHTLWSGWKQSLLEQLYHLTSSYLTKSHLFKSNWRQRIKQNKHEASELFISQCKKITLANIVDNQIVKHSLYDSALSELLETFWRRCRVDYLMYHHPKQLAWHAQMLLIQEPYSIDSLDDNYRIKIINNLPPAAIHATNQFVQGGTELFVWCKDRQNLFVAIVSLMERRNISVLHAQIFTNRDNMAMDSFVISERTGTPLSLARQALIKKELHQLVLQNELLVTKIKPKKQVEHYFQHQTEIKFIESDNISRTYIEINALDRPGLLFTIANVFAQFSLSLLGARITTIGERVEDMFIITTNQRLALDETLKQQLKQKLLTEIEFL